MVKSSLEDIIKKRPPISVKPGQKLELTIERVGSQGDGIGSWEGSMVVVPQTAQGDKISCVVKYSTRERIHADLLDVLKSGEGRGKAPCQYYGSCGGCNLQHMKKETYKRYKLEVLADALERNGVEKTFKNVSWFSVGAESRRRAFLRYDGKLSFGFYAHQSHEVVDIKECMMLEPEIQRLISPLKDLSRKMPETLEGWMITIVDNGIDLVMVDSNSKKIENEDHIVDLLTKFCRAEKISRLQWKLGEKLKHVYTVSKPITFINGKEVVLPGEYFLQASKKGQEAIVGYVRDYVKNDAKVLDLFSGLGIYSFALCDKASHISAYEISKYMIESMQDNITRNKLSNKISAICRDIEKLPIYREELQKYDTAIINPPRTGALKQVSNIAGSGIKNVIMISCNSQTFARDAKVLTDGGYKLSALHAIDQFYYNHHLEQVGYFVKGPVMNKLL